MANPFRSLRRDCLICGGARSDCRQNTQSGLIHCRHDVSVVSGWRFIGTDAHGFGMWAVDDGRIHSNADWEAQQRQRAAERERRLKEEAENFAQLLSVEERDRQIRRLHEQLGLTAGERQNLRARGLTNDEINAGKFFSIDAWQEVVGISPRLAGVDITGNKLVIGQPGFACPIWDTEGNIIGWQTRFHDETHNKYRWPTSRSKKRPNGATAHLQNGELPISCCRPVDGVDCSSLGLAEGFLKPYIAAQRLSQVIIGAAGGNFAGSPQQLKGYLEALSQELGTKTVDLYPDAGAIANSSVMGHYERTIQLVQSWGYTVRVAWWEQVDKSFPDVDEIADFSSIIYLTPDNFLNGRYQEQSEETAEDEIYSRLTQLTAEPWKKINTSELDLESLNLPLGAIYVVASPKGTGKTNALKPITRKFNNIYAWFSRIALGREECNRIGVTWKDDLGSFTGSIRAGFCADSAYAFPPKHLLKNGLLLVDEADQVFEHMFGETCNRDGKRPSILASLQAQLNTVIAGNSMALFMSADITDKELDYIQQIAPPGCPVRLIVNHYKPPLGDVLFNESDKPDGLIEELLEDLENGTPTFVIDDLRTGVKGCKSIAEYFRKVHPEWADKIVEINSDTSGNPEIIEYLKNINVLSETTLLLICTPSVTSGISIQNGHFKNVYGFLNGILTVSNGSQALARVRGAELIKVWAAKKGLVYAADHSLFPHEIKAYFQRNYQANAKHILGFGVEYNPLKDEWDSPHFELYCKYAAYRNCCMDDLRIRLRDRLTEEGYQIFRTTSGQSDMVKEGLKDAWNYLEIRHAHGVAGANILSDEQLKALENRPLTPEQKLDVEKTYLLKTYGQDLIDAMIFEHKSGEILTGWPAMALKDNRGQYRKQLEAFYLLTTDAEVALAKDVRAEQRQLEQGAGRFAGDVRWHTRQRKAREFLGLNEFLNPETWWSPLDYASLAQQAKRHASKVKDALGFAVEKMTGGQIFGELLGQLGLELTKKWGPGLLPNGKRYKLRQVTAESYCYAEMYVEYRSSLRQEHEAAPATTYDHPPHQYSSTPLGGGDQGQSQQSHGLEAVSVSGFEPEDSDNKTASAAGGFNGEDNEAANFPTDIHSASVRQSLDHPPHTVLSGVLGGGDQASEHTQQGFESVLTTQFSATNSSVQVTPAPSDFAVAATADPADSTTAAQQDVIAQGVVPGAQACEHTEVTSTPCPTDGQVPEPARTPTPQPAALWGIGLILPGTVVECLGRAGRWVVKYSTGVVAKIIDSHGREEYASCENLRLAATHGGVRLAI